VVWLFFGLGAVAGGTGVYAWRQVEPPADLPPRRLEATVFLPVTGNPKQPFTQNDWDNAVDLLVSEFGGATLGPPLEGRWSDEQRVQREQVRPVVISFERDRLPAFRRALQEVGRRLGQEAVYARYEEPRIDLLTVSPQSSQKDH
jgi:hypothetical protein